MRQILARVFAVGLVLGIVACDKKASNNTGGTPPNAEVSVNSVAGDTR